jgi:hypothetical protein
MLQYILLILLIIIILYYLNNYLNNNIENFENINEHIGNYLTEYFYNYALSICNKNDFIYNIDSKSDIIKDLPTHIIFDEELYNEFIKYNITEDNLKGVAFNAIWHCDQDWIIDMWQILKKKFNIILLNALQKSNFISNSKYPIIHFRCSDVPFIKHFHYFMQKYQFFKSALEKIDFKNNPEKKIILKSCFSHGSNKNNVDACTKYVYMLQTYINNLGYNCIIECKTNVEDFADMFYAPNVISTGGSFAFISGFLGNGTFISTEHKIENKTTCNNIHCNNIFIKDYNINHSVINSYYNIDDVKNYLIS